jgi:peptidoglycan-associated lipoprotein
MKLLNGIVFAVAAFAAGCTCTPQPRPGDVGDDKGNLGFDEGGPLKDIHFAFDSYKLSEEAKGILKWNAQWLKENPSKNVQVEGHCDERGTEEYNQVLGANRARAAQDYLRSLGIEAKRTSTVSYGENMPKNPAHNEAAWAENRRDHFRVD